MTEIEQFGPACTTYDGRMITADWLDEHGKPNLAKLFRSAILEWRVSLAESHSYVLQFANHITIFPDLVYREKFNLKIPKYLDEFGCKLIMSEEPDEIKRWIKLMKHFD